jgi:hypothetical protein
MFIPKEGEVTGDIHSQRFNHIFSAKEEERSESAKFFKVLHYLIENCNIDSVASG